MRIRSRTLTKVAAAVAVALLRLLFWTCRQEVRLARPGTCPYKLNGDNRHLYCMWHDMVAFTVFAQRPLQMAGLVSRHQDGSYLADGMQMVGIKPIRGSSNRGGVKAMRELIETAHDRHVAITPDGPRGPRRQMKSGIVFLASHSGRSIIPVAHSCRRVWRIRGSWTDMLMPMPFSKIYSLGGAPISVPPNLTREQLEQYTQRVQEAMDRLDAEAQRLVHADELEPPSGWKAAA